MADVVRIEERMPRGPRKHVRLAADAKILLFTGVRYERVEFPVQPALKPSESVKH